MSNMIHFLSDMAVNPKMQNIFWESPTEVMASVGLPERVWSGLSSHNNVQVTSAIVNELVADEVEPILGNAVAADPGPDPWDDPPPPPPSDDEDEDEDEDEED